MSTHTATDMSVGYLTSVYPALSHTFIFREIQVLRAHGVRIGTASIKRPDFIELMSSSEGHEYETTAYIQSTPAAEILLSHLRLFVRRPKGYLKALSYALSLRHKGTTPLHRLLGYFAEMAPLLAWMQSQKLNHLHIHFGNPAATVAMIAAETGEVSFSMSIHGSDIFYDESGNLLSEKIAKARFVRCISHFAQCQVMRHTPFPKWSKLHIVRCGIDPRVFQPRPVPANAVTQIVCVGRLIVAKGIFVLLQACRALREQGFEFHITLVGGGPEQGAIEAAATELGIRDRLTITGPVGQEDVHAYLDQADMMVLPSFAEGIPVVLMEAMAKEVFCISSRITGIPELIEDGLNGFLITPSDWMELAQKMKVALEDPALRARMGRKGRQTVLSKYDINKNAQNMGSLFAQYLAQEGGTST